MSLALLVQSRATSFNSLADTFHNYMQPGMVAQLFTPSTMEAEAGGSLCVGGQPGNIQFQGSQGYNIRETV